MSYILSGFSIDILKSKNGDLEIIEQTGIDLYLFLSQFSTILVPALIFLFIFHYKNFKEWVRVKPPKLPVFFALAVLFLLMSYPLIQFSADINSKLAIAEWMKDHSEAVEKVTKMLLVFNSPLDLIIRILLIGLLPAIGEELYFRAGIQNELASTFKNPDVAIFITALLFSAFHLQFDGFLPRFFLGLMLGYIYYWSGSILVPVLIHFINNSMLIISAYAMRNQLEQLDQLTNETSPQIPLYLLIISMITVFMLRIQMIKLKKISESPNSIKSENDEQI